ncbi:hypothetical protein GCM10009785_01610 [Brooklawnia cerclae]|uniref:DUF7426 domain-containing protein n=1 Tax=Brooklawnia cerclae TaxID=349934 RepID=A0ABX0SE09_9ACTN|nr:hypothetical protein [Brooklawnia cerclae]NIH56245.1 hypothetical protein [Brooklawnia cerclae]
MTTTTSSEPETIAVNEDLNPCLHVEIGGHVYDIKPPSARAGLQAKKILSAIQDAEDRGVPVDLDALQRRLGITDPVNYDIDVALFGDLYDQLLDDLDIDQFGIVEQAMFIWVTTSKDLAEFFLQDPTASPANRAQRRAAAKQGTKTAAKKPVSRKRATSR